MAQNQGKWMARRHAIKGKTNIRVTDPAARNFYDYFVRTGIKNRTFATLQRNAANHQLETMGAMNAGHSDSLLIREALCIFERSFKYINAFSSSSRLTSLVLRSVIRNRG